LAARRRRGRSRLRAGGVRLFPRINLAPVILIVFDCDFTSAFGLFILSQSGDRPLR